MRKITNIRLPKALKTSSDDDFWYLVVDQDDIVCSVNAMEIGTGIRGDSWQGDWISPMGVDIQMNGGLGLSFNDLKIDDIPKLYELLDRLWVDGVEAICPTIVSCSISSLRTSLEVLRLVRNKKSSCKCKLLGSHLEGPFLSHFYKGAHDLNFLFPPSLKALEERIKGYEDDISLVTIAPELPGAFEVIDRLHQLGIRVSLGHSQADEGITASSFKHGVSMITHAFNAMPPLHHRAPGPLGAAIANGDITIGLIADGKHVHPSIAQMLHKLSAEKIVLVSDALSVYGLNIHQYHWDNRILLINDGLCTLDDGTLVGTNLPLLEGCKRFSEWTQDISSSIWAATVSPRLLFDKGKTVNDFLIGKSLNSLLRWKVNADSGKCSWHPAA